MGLRLSSRKGASAIEFALILPILLILVFGIIEFSIILFNKAMITNASREGARQGIVFRADPDTGDYYPYTDDEIRAVVTNYLGNNLINFAENSHVTTIAGTKASGELLTVSVNYQYSFLVLPNFIADMAGGLNLQATTVMRME